MTKYYTCQRCSIIFDTNDRQPICPMCRIKNYGFKYFVRSIFNTQNLKEFLKIIIIYINIIIWMFGVIFLVDLLT